MDFLEFSRKRYSVRSYSDRPVEQDKIDKILQAAMIAPTAVNYQPQKIYVLKSNGRLAKNKAYYEKYIQCAACILGLCGYGEKLA